MFKYTVEQIQRLRALQNETLAIEVGESQEQALTQELLDELVRHVLNNITVYNQDPNELFESPGCHACGCMGPSPGYTMCPCEISWKVYRYRYDIALEILSDEQ